jgi:hypothetical protein
LGQYYQQGAWSYLRQFAVYWATVTVFLLMWGAVLRLVLEPVALAMTIAAPARSAQARRFVERTGRLLYYGGVPVALALRFWPW